MNIVGISFGYHDSAVCLLRDGKIIFALQEERISRVKNDPRFPELATQELLRFNKGLKIDAVVFYEKSFLKFDRIIHEFIQTWPLSYGQFRRALPAWLGNKLKVKQQIYSHFGGEVEIFFSRHHESHAASAYYTSGFTEAAILTLDGVGEWECGAIHHGFGHKIQTLESRIYPDSIGLFYSGMTDYLGFEVNEGEYKVMGLAPYGEPKYVDLFKKYLLDVDPQGRVFLKREALSYPVAERLFKVPYLESMLGFPKRDPREPIEQRHFDLAASVQKILEEVVLASARFALQRTGSKKLCFAGGVALNCVANGKILSQLRAEGLLEEFHLFSASGDAGGSVGAALFYYHHLLKKPVAMEKQILPYWGPEYNSEQIRDSLQASGLKYHHLSSIEEARSLAVKNILEGKIIGWFQGKLEFGPRALGNRSILGDPRAIENWARINHMIKFREDFRPLAPAVLKEVASNYFMIDQESPLMLLVAPTKVDFLPATTHVDGSARVQTVDKNEASGFWELIKEFGDQSGVYALINTSMNTSGMPIVCAPKDAIRCFIESDLQSLFLGQYFVSRDENPWLFK